MDVEKISPSITNFLKFDLDKNIIDYLCKIIYIGRKNNKNFNSKLG